MLPPTTPWTARDGWRLGARAQRNLIFRSGAYEKSIEVQLPCPWAGNFGWTAKPAIVRGRLEGDTALTLEIDAGRCHARVIRSAATEHVFIKGHHYAVSQVDPLTVTPAIAANPTGLRSPMPGRVIELIASAGTEVARGQPLLVLEAMKIEHTIMAPWPGYAACLQGGGRRTGGRGCGTGGLRARAVGIRKVHADLG